MQLALYVLALLHVVFVRSSPVQKVLEIYPDQVSKPRQLHGRFLHITDLHPDGFYVAGSSTSRLKACHRGEPKKKKKKAGYYGAPYTECDSPFQLTNYTLDFLDKNWADIDFVVWTGDNARHDNDLKHPRTTKVQKESLSLLFRSAYENSKEIYDLNRAVARKMSQVFSSKGIPVVPSLGNNDIWPHVRITLFICIPTLTSNYIYTLEHLSSSITNEFSQIWQSFIPFPYLQVFHRGAYFAVEVVPDRLAVISLNTLYFYDSNKAVGGCSLTDREDPGNLQFDWLEVQLEIFKERGMQVWLTGHVPPSSSNYFPECYVRYVHLALRFQDIGLSLLPHGSRDTHHGYLHLVVGHLFGHMNMDHFFFLEAEDLELDSDIDSSASTHNYLYDSLLQDFALLPKSNKVNLDEYAVINVSPSVVPNPYLPTFRIFAYNVTETEEALTEDGLTQKTGEVDTQKKRLPGHHRGKHGNKASLCKRKPYRDSWKCKLFFSPPSDPNAPSRSSRLWTPLGYAQYHIPSLGDADKTAHPRFELEYTTFPFSALLPGEGQNETEFRYPIPLKNLPKSLRDGTRKDRYCGFDMKDLTVGSWMELASRLGDRKEIGLRKKFRKYMYLGGSE
ncbi:hypothetical protein D9757_004904 [Collybiopsis confluens]|uniref:Calcineurin-like phosphoesterase domain-containing protein n=1 Tax=Collybiopsis confluens TaxID=2823264 RepID=A0A8H5MC63_9AGAR|nr:hypothetical protein D9757_004904 [Collybiopsis confluens]